MPEYLQNCFADRIDSKTFVEKFVPPLFKLKTPSNYKRIFNLWNRLKTSVKIKRAIVCKKVKSSSRCQTPPLQKEKMPEIK